MVQKINFEFTASSPHYRKMNVMSAIAIKYKNKITNVEANTMGFGLFGREGLMVAANIMSAIAIKIK